MSDEREPDTLNALTECFAEAQAQRKPTIVLGAGCDGSARPQSPSVLLRTDALPRRITVDAHSGIAQVTAWSTWAEVEHEVRATGWTVSHLHDADPSASVGGTLARPALLPPLWMSHTSVAACIGAEAISSRGERYSYAEAPRTSSGPDWRALWFGSEGQGGALTRVSLELARDTSVTAHRVSARRVSALRLRGILEPFLNITQLAPASSDAWRVRVRGGSHRAALARTQLKAAGFADVPVQLAAWPERALLVAAPWSDTNTLRRFDLPAGAVWQSWASGPTHVLWALTAERAGASDFATVAHQVMSTSGAELRRCTYRGFLRPERATTWLPRDINKWETA